MTSQDQPHAWTHTRHRDSKQNPWRNPDSRTELSRGREKRGYCLNIERLGHRGRKGIHPPLNQLTELLGPQQEDSGSEQSRPPGPGTTAFTGSLQEQPGSNSLSTMDPNQNTLLYAHYCTNTDVSKGISGLQFSTLSHSTSLSYHTVTFPGLRSFNQSLGSPS